MISSQAIEATNQFGAGRPINELSLVLEHLEYLENHGFTVTNSPNIAARNGRDAGRDADKLPVPRLQLRWDDIGNCHYEMIIALSEHDIRREKQNGDKHSRFMAISLGLTRVRGGNGPVNDDGVVDTPHRDGSHARWDGAQLGLPVYAVYGEYATRLETVIPPSLLAEQKKT